MMHINKMHLCFRMKSKGSSTIGVIVVSICVTICVVVLSILSTRKENILKQRPSIVARQQAQPSTFHIPPITHLIGHKPKTNCDTEGKPSDYPTSYLHQKEYFDVAFDKVRKIQSNVLKDIQAK